MSCTILPASDTSIQQAAKRLKSKQLVAFPTETVYGLGANALEDMAVTEIYAMKSRPSFNPLIVHVADLESAKRYAVFTQLALKIAEHFWPGPLTLVLNRTGHCPLSHLVSAGLDTVAIRVPGHPLAQKLLRAADLPIAAPSANQSGRISPTIAKHVAEEFKDKDLLVLDGGACDVGLESTVVDARGAKPLILRHGFVTAEDLQLNCMTPVEIACKETPASLTSPGMLASHYAPSIPVRLNANSANEGEALLAFGNHAPVGANILNLSPSGNLKEAAANLFAYMRKLDDPKYSAMAVMPIPNDGLGLAINDRLTRAATR